MVNFKPGKYETWLIRSAILGGFCGGVAWLIVIFPTFVRPLTTYSGHHQGEEAFVNRYVAPLFAFLGSFVGIIAFVTICLIAIAIDLGISTLKRRNSRLGD